jgi:hypothetical protein
VDDTLRTAVAGAFKAFMTVQTQGLALLNDAWLGSIHERQIKQQVAAIQVVLDAMRDFEALLIATIDQQIAASLQTSGQRLTGLAASNDIRWDYGSGDVRMQYPLNDDWLMWDSGWGFGGMSLFMAYRPWNYGTQSRVELTCEAPGNHQDEPHIHPFGLAPRPEDQQFLKTITVSRYNGIPTELAFIRFKPLLRILDATFKTTPLQSIVPGEQSFVATVDWETQGAVTVLLDNSKVELSGSRQYSWETHEFGPPTGARPPAAISATSDDGQTISRPLEQV